MSPSSDLAIVGAGAAGLMSAIAAARQNPALKIILFDTRQKIGAKILISGGTRCNVTNVKVRPTDYQGAPNHFVKHVLEAFTPDQTKKLFEEMGVELILEPTGKYFPTTHSGKTVLEALMKEVARLGVTLKTGVRITNIKSGRDGFLLSGSDLEGKKHSFNAARVILASGGLSYPETGSDGGGLAMAKTLGHTIIPTCAALTPLLTNDQDWNSLSGITIDTKLSFFENNKKVAECEGALLFTHFGFSGPVALDISRFVSTAIKDTAKFEVTANFLPSQNPASLKTLLESTKKNHPDKLIKNFLSDSFGFATRFAEVFLKKIKADPKTTFRQLTSRDLGKFINFLLQLPIPVTGVYGYKKAEVTAGGIDTKEIKVSTMESKKVPGLYFAGEIVDVDGRIGGFNFQWAWSSGTVAGRSAAK